MGLIGISPLISPDLLVTLARMGHGDSICFADANFPSDSLQSAGKRGPITIRADGLEVAQLLRAVTKLFPLDSYTEFPVQMMAPVPGDDLDPSIEERFRTAVEAEQVRKFAYSLCREQKRRAVCSLMCARSSYICIGYHPLLSFVMITRDHSGHRGNLPESHQSLLVRVRVFNTTAHAHCSPTCMYTGRILKDPQGNTAVFCL